ncbi:MAG: alpha/beta hydrolase [Porphyromonadaceae bacterium]|nr:alpha/beta hydrolase [Porphyromonadaceae bacterium]
MNYFGIVLFLVAVFIPQIYYRRKKHESVMDFSDLTFNVFEEDNDKYKKVLFKSYDDFILDAKLYEAEDTKAVVQIIHGALEHKDRYIDMINYLVKSGYSCFISDNRGHGLSTDDRYELGYMDGAEKIVYDNFLITEYLNNRFLGKKIYIFGHSLGSIFARIYLQDCDLKIDKLVLCGPPNFNPMSYLAKFFGNIFTFYLGEHRTLLIFKFLYRGKERYMDSISYDTDNLLAIKNDDLMPAVYKNRAYLTVFESVEELNNLKKFKCQNKDLDILIIAGKEDPFTGFENGLSQTIKDLTSIGYRNIKKIVYDSMKHEIIHEQDKEIVFKDLVNFFDENY